MSDWNPRLRRLALTLWLGGQWMVGWGVAPILFAQLDSQLAGALAGRAGHRLVEHLSRTRSGRRDPDPLGPRQREPEDLEALWREPGLQRRSQGADGRDRRGQAPGGLREYEVLDVRYE